MHGPSVIVQWMVCGLLLVRFRKGLETAGCVIVTQRGAGGSEKVIIRLCEEASLIVQNRSCGSAFPVGD
jgi:hypothetical protein